MNQGILFVVSRTSTPTFAKGTLITTYVIDALKPRTQPSLDNLPEVWIMYGVDKLFVGMI